MELYGRRVLLSIDALENNREVSRDYLGRRPRPSRIRPCSAGVAAVWLPGCCTLIYTTTDHGCPLHRRIAIIVTDNVIMDHRINDLAEMLVVSPYGSNVFEVGQDERQSRSGTTTLALRS